MALDKYQLEALARHGATEADTKPKVKNNDEKIAELEAQNEMLTECILELASIIYA